MLPHPIPRTFLEQFEAKFNLYPFDKSAADGNDTLALTARLNRFKLWFQLSDIETTYAASDYHNPTVLSLYTDFYHKVLNYIFNVHPLGVHFWMELGRADALSDSGLIDTIVESIIHDIIPSEYFRDDERELGLMALEIAKTYAVEIHPRLVGNPIEPL